MKSAAVGVFAPPGGCPHGKVLGIAPAQENRALREELFAKQIYDGYLVYIDGEPQGWCQVGQT